MRRAAIPALIAAALAIAACQSSSDNTTSLTPTVVEPPSITETFMGTVPVKGFSSSPFTVSQVGTVSITLTAAGPPPTIFMGIGVGTPDSNGVCQVLSTNAVPAQASTAPQLSGTVSQTGAYCVSVFDIGNQSDTVTYSVTVTHPK